jgi:hypothetical protein
MQLVRFSWQVEEISVTYLNRLKVELLNEYIQFPAADLLPAYHILNLISGECVHFRTLFA